MTTEGEEGTRSLPGGWENQATRSDRLQSSQRKDTNRNRQEGYQNRGLGPKTPGRGSGMPKLALQREGQSTSSTRPRDSEPGTSRGGEGVSYRDGQSSSSTRPRTLGAEQDQGTPKADPDPRTLALVASTCMQSLT